MIRRPYLEQVTVPDLSAWEWPAIGFRSRLCSFGRFPSPATDPKTAAERGPKVGSALARASASRFFGPGKTLFFPRLLANQ
jgi:hypothetical protein